MRTHRKTGAELIVDFLVRAGVRTVVGIPGGSNLPLYDALQRSPIQHVLARHEQGAGFMAQGMARSTGRPGVCLASSGPGSTNLTTPLADAKMDSVPVVAITGQVPTSLIGTDAFQEVDTRAMMRPITKGVFMPHTVEDLADTLEQAWDLCQSGRPGPVLVDIPKDVQQAFLNEISTTETADRRMHLASPCAPAPSSATAPEFRTAIQRAAHMISEAERPVLYAGGGIVHAEAATHLGALARNHDIPVALTLLGLGCFDPEDDLYLGMLGMHGNHSTNHAIDEADLVIAIGARFDDRATGAHSFAPQARIIHADIDAREIGKIRSVDLGVRCDARAFLSALLPQLRPMRRPDWRRRITELRAEDHVPDEWDENPLHPVHLLHTLARHADPATIFTTDVGQHQMWTARHLPIRSPRGLLTSGGLGTMGFGVPAAIGAALACPERPVVCITGDGSLFMNIQELSTIAEIQPDLKILVFNNNHLGLVRQQQDLFYSSNFFAIRYDRPADYARVAQAMGIKGIRAAEHSDMDDLLRRALSEPGPVLIDLPIDETLHVLPMVPPGKANVQAILRT